jgi:hypothetical protein
MSETNGNPASEWRERFDRLEASHIRLMTDHEVFVAEQDREWERQKERWREYEIDREAAKVRGAQIDAQLTALGERIDQLVSGFGEFLRRAANGGKGNA